MKKEKVNISVLLLGFLLSSLVLFPYVVKFEHLFEDHEHVTCTDNATHLHESTLHCSIDAFSFSSYNMSFDTPLFSDEIIPYPKRNYNYQRHHFILDKRFIKLRGPPGLTT